MTHLIDVHRVLRGAVCDLYSNLVTRPTGAAVRTAIEAMLAERHSPTITTIDFSHVQLLDVSCADEIVAKLLLLHVDGPMADDRYVCFRGMSDDHLDAVEAVLEHRALALVWDREGQPELLGRVDDDERQHWDAVRAHGPTRAAQVAQLLARDEAHSTAQLDRLWRRRLVMRRTNGYSVPRGLPGVAV